MPDRKPEPWESGAAGPFLWIEGSPSRFGQSERIASGFTAAGHEQLVTGFRRTFFKRGRFYLAP
jgi:hypothetical protein